VSKTAPQVVFKGTVKRHGGPGFVELPFDPKPVFGQVRAPVKVTMKGVTFRSRIVAMGGPACIGFGTSQREALGLEGGENIDVRLELDVEPRVVTPPKDLVKALKAAPPAWDRWQELSYTHQREHAQAVEGAKKPETRGRRITNAVAMVRAMKPKAKAKKMAR
jgi:hypothetical protein